MLRRERQGEGYASLGELGDAYPGAKADLEVGRWVGGWVGVGVGGAWRMGIACLSSPGCAYSLPPTSFCRHQCLCGCRAAAGAQGRRPGAEPARRRHVPPRDVLPCGPAPAPEGRS